MRLLIFSYEVPSGAKSGRELLAQLNAMALTDVVGKDVHRLTVDPSAKPGSFSERLRALGGWLDGLTLDVADQCVSEIQARNIDVIYIEGSNYGRLARYIRKKAPSCQVVTFFHNVEARFFWGSLRAHPSIKAVGVLFANWLAEFFAVTYSHRVICLNRRDSKLLRRLYGAGATDIHPMCIASVHASRDATATSDSSWVPVFGLFVGGAFYANVAGIRWFTRHVSQSLPCPIYVVGKGFEKYRDELEAFPNLRVVGTVESLHEWYVRSSFVIAPIFDGSGMKTKVAESLMYGKPVVGTTEAFVGYESVADRVGVVCDTPTEFLTAIGEIVSGSRTFEPSELRVIYDQRYSYDAKKRKFQDLLQSLAPHDQ